MGYFMPDPTASTLSGNDLMQSAIEQPFSRSQVFGSSLAGGMLDTYGLGTYLKGVTATGGVRQVPDDINGGSRPETSDEVAQRGDSVMSEDQYKASPYFRQSIPWDAGMTQNRAASLATFDDWKSVREEIARKSPWTSMAGNFAGSALDPINYIPVLGEGAGAAAIGRFGTIGGRALVGAADAAANVGIAGLLTAPVRQQFGDDTSWQGQVSQMAMGAALGAGFGALGGVFQMRSDAHAAAAKADLESRMSTIRAGQDSMATLQEAVAGIANDGEVRLGDGSLDRLDTLHNDMADAAPEIEATSRALPEMPIDYANRMLAEQMPDEVRTLQDHDVAISQNEGAIKDIQNELADPRFTETSASFIQARDLDAKYQRLSDAADKANSDKSRGQLQEQLKKVQTQVEALFAKLDPATVDRLDHLEQSLPLRQQALDTARKAREPLAAKIDEARQGHIAQYLAEPIQPSETAVRLAPVEAPAGPAPRAPREVVASQPKVDAAPPEPIKASAEVGKPDTLDKIAEQHSVNPETGSFPEQFELDQLDREGRMDATAKAEMKTANDNMEAAKSWGDVLRAAVTCLI